MREPGSAMAGKSDASKDDSRVAYGVESAVRVRVVIESCVEAVIEIELDDLTERVNL